MLDQDPERKTDADAPVPEHIDIPNDDTIITDDAAPEDVTAQSSGAEDVASEPKEEPQSMMEAVEAQMGKPSDPESETKPDQKPEGAEAKTGTGDDGEEPEQDFLDQDVTEDEVKDYSKKAQARIRQLVQQRNEASEKAQTVEPILGFLEKNDIPQQDLDVILDLTARLRHGDFQGFLQGVQPYVNLAMQYTGQALPPDLQKQVKEGYVSREAASELAQRRIQAHMHGEQTRQRDTRDQQRNVQDRANSIRSAVTNWEQQVRAQDPDYGLKEDLIRRTAQGLMQEGGIPQTVEQALGYVQQAYKEVNGQMGKLRPPKQATQRTPNGSVTKGGSAPTAQPNSMMEAAMQGLRDARGG